MPLSWLGLRSHRQVRRRARISGKERLPNGVKQLSGARSRRIDLRFSRAIRRWPTSRLPHALGSSQRQGLQDAAAEPRGGLPLHLHAREPVRHEPSVHAPQADGLHHAPMPWARSRRGLGAGRVHLQPRPPGKPSVGEPVIVDLMRKRAEAEEGLFRSHAHPHGLSVPEPQGLGGPRYSARPAIRCSMSGWAIRRSMPSNAPTAPSAISR